MNIIYLLPNNITYALNIQDKIYEIYIYKIFNL